jgi:hypothetical protein
MVPKAPDSFIVKVQTSIATSHSTAQMLIYNKDRTVQWEGPTTSHVFDKLNGALKDFFYAYMDNTVIVITDQAPWQDW